MSARGGAKMSNKSKENRIKKRRICNIIHNVTWIAESLTVLAAVVIQLTMDVAFNQDPMIIQSISEVLSTLSLHRIITPFAHLFNEKRIKDMILEHGWICAAKAALKFNRSSRRIEPNQPTSHSRQQINTISSRIHAFKKSEPKSKNEIKIDPIRNRTFPSTSKVISNNDHHGDLYPLNRDNSGREIINMLPNMVTD